MLVLVVYDIADNRRRHKVSASLEGHGRRVQESVFECFLGRDEMKRLHRMLERQVVAAEDNVRLYWISSGALAKTLTIGSAEPQPPPNALIF